MNIDRYGQPHVVVNTWDENGNSVISDVPDGAHLILMNDEMPDQLFLRSGVGYKLTYVKGDREREGWYRPQVLCEDDGYVLVNREHLLTAMNELAAAPHILNPEEASKVIFSFLRRYHRNP